MLRRARIEIEHNAIDEERGREGVHFCLYRWICFLQTSQALTGQSTVGVPIDGYPELMHRITMEVRSIDPLHFVCVL